MAADSVKFEKLSKGAWTPEEDRKLAEVIASYGAKRWKIIAAKAGLSRCGKSCRLRWLNYLRPNIKRGNISDQEEDLILRLHKLLGNRWALIAGRLPGRTDNEIKNYWNSHLSKKVSKRGRPREESKPEESEKITAVKVAEESKSGGISEDLSSCSSEFNVEEFFDFSDEDPRNLEWLNQFVQLDPRASFTATLQQ